MAKPQIGDTVTYYYWAQGELHSTLALVTGVYDEDEGPLALALDVDFSDEVMALEGYVREQSHSRRRVLAEDSVHASGAWTPTP